MTKRFGIARILSKAGLCSRSEAVRLVEAGRVQVNGVVVLDAEFPCIASQDQFLVDGQVLQQNAKIYYMLNKPRGLVTTASDEQGRETVYRCFQNMSLPHIAPVGRLDKASEGLLLFTNDSSWANRILDPENHCPKIYHVQIQHTLAIPELLALRQGFECDGEFLKAESVDLLRSGEKTSWYAVKLIQGKNRQIRRMFQHLGFNVLRLVRVQIGNVELGDLPKGEVRPLSAVEIDRLNHSPK